MKFVEFWSSAWRRLCLYAVSCAHLPSLPSEVSLLLYTSLDRFRGPGNIKCFHICTADCFWWWLLTFSCLWKVELVCREGKLTSPSCFLVPLKLQLLPVMFKVVAWLFPALPLWTSPPVSFSLKSSRLSGQPTADMAVYWYCGLSLAFITVCLCPGSCRSAPAVLVAITGRLKPEQGSICSVQYSSSVTAWVVGLALLAVVWSKSALSALSAC